MDDAVVSGESGGDGEEITWMNEMKDWWLKKKTCLRFVIG